MSWAAPENDSGRRWRVVIVAERAAANGGTGSHVLASSIALRRAGADVLLALGEPIDDETFPIDHTVIEGLATTGAVEEFLPHLSGVIEAIQPDVVHVQQLADAGVVGTLRRHAPVLYDVHNHLVCTSGTKYFRSPRQVCRRRHGAGCVPNLLLRGCAHGGDPRALPEKYRRVSRRLEELRAADAVVAHSAFVLDELRLNEVPRAIRVPLFADPRDSPASPANGPIVFVGRVSEAKGVGTFLRAIAGLDAPVEIVGDGWWLPRAKRLAGKLGIDERVAFRGWLPPDRLRRAYEAARVVVVPSHWPEPFGLVGIEAMAAGRPVVGTRTGGIPDWLADEETGLLVEPGSASAVRTALRRLLSNPQEAARMGAAGLARVREEFSESRYLEALEDAYRLAKENWQAR